MCPELVEGRSSTGSERKSAFTPGRACDVGFPPVMSVAGCNCRNVHEDFDGCYRAVQSKDRAVRWLVCHRGADDGDLLPAQLPGPSAVRTQRPLLSDFRGSPACRIPRVQALPSGRFTRLSRMEYAR